MVAFSPIAMMTGLQGNFFKMIPIVVVPVLFFSIVESKFILPAHLKHCRGLGKLKTRTTSSCVSAIFRQRFGIFDPQVLPARAEFAYISICTAALFIAILLVFVGYIAGDRLPYSSFPRLPRDRVSVTLQMPAGTTFGVLRAR